MLFWSLLVLLPASLALQDIEPPLRRVRSGTTRDDEDITTGFFDVRLTHFHAHNTDTFPMRYFYNPVHIRGENPAMVIVVGGEWTITESWMLGGLPYEIAEHLGAGLFYTEHRYYGETRPTNDTSVSELRWLTVDQALADLAQFIKIVKSDSFQNGIFRNAKVILTGCSYAGTMVTWMRLAYPHLVDAVFSDSGPLHAQEDFPEYLETITEALRAQGSQQCVDSIREGMVGLKALVQSNPQTVSNMFNTCSQLDASSGLDVATFYWYGITETFAYLVQYAFPGDIPAACSILTDASVTDATQRLANWVTQQSWTQPCIETRYSVVLNRHTNTSYDADQLSTRLWTYQLCVEFGWWQTTSGENQVFLDVVPLDYFRQMCRDFFSSYFDDERTRSGIERTNTFFGGLTFRPDHVVTVQGTHDPWSPMGPKETHATFLAPVYVVPETAHCMALLPTSPDDPAEMQRVKRNVKNNIFSWVGAEPIQDGATSVLASTILVLAGIVAAIL
ncbi:hypothetical protein O0L34_g10250 [Tuta absoluta]|nr:hypothetical protein O0L34_g10250 [Tuta absoluta]